MKKTLILIAVVAIGAFAWWTISPLFIDKVVEDELDPEIAILLETEDKSVATGDAFTLTAETNFESETIEETAAVVKESTLTPDEASTMETEPEPVPASTSPIARGPFVITDTPGHPATGNIRVIETAEQALIRYENYDGTNGPDLKVYLTNDLDKVGDFVSLGAAKGNRGNINYTVPDAVDVNDFTYVVTWCEAFGVLFDYAQIN